jgi:hypothetical protein
MLSRLATGLAQRGFNLLESTAQISQISFLLDAGLLALHVAVLGHKILVNQILEILRALRGNRHSLFQLAHQLLRRAQFRLALGGFSLNPALFGADFGHLACKQALCLGEFDVVHSVRSRQLQGSATVQRGQHGLPACHLQPGHPQIALHPILVGLCGGGIQLDQHVTGFDLLPVRDMDGLDGGGFKRLDGLGAIVRHHLALRRGHHVDMAEAGPHHCQQCESDQHPHCHTRCRRDGRLLQGERGGQKLRLVRKTLGRLHAGAVLPCVAECSAVAFK